MDESVIESQQSELVVCIERMMATNTASRSVGLRLGCRSLEILDE